MGGFFHGFFLEENRQNLYLEVLECSLRPFFEMLKKWIYEGVIQDPHEEFMVKEFSNIDKGRSSNVSSPEQSLRFWGRIQF